jgi:hypothetical protein
MALAGRHQGDAMYYVYRSTTDKLNEAFQRIEEAGDKPAALPVFTGGRDWVIFVEKAPAPVDHEAEFEALFGKPKP